MNPIYFDMSSVCNIWPSECDIWKCRLTCDISKKGFHLYCIYCIRQVPRPTSFGKWGGGPMVLKVGNFSSQACTDQNSCGIGNCGTDLDFRTSQLAPCIAELRFHPPSAELELNLSRPPCAPRAPPVRPRPSISLQQ